MLRKNKFVLITLFLIVVVFVLIYYLSFLNIKHENNINLKKYYDNYNASGYFAIIKIPKLKLENIIYKKGNLNNNVNKNIYLINDNRDFIVIAAHSGSSPISYFKKIHTLNSGDKIELVVDGLKRTYELFKKEKIKKTGKVKLKTYTYPIVVLITCSKSEKNVQEVYYNRLISSQKLA